MVSIIIPVTSINTYLNESIVQILNLEEQQFEVLILPDDGACAKLAVPTEQLRGKVRVIPTGSLGPAAKRNIGAKQARGEILAFLDDDAYPRRDWLTRALTHFEDAEIAAVGGPAVTPPDDSFWQKVSGAVYLSPLGGGNSHRYWPGKKTYFVDDWPSVNLLIRKRDFDNAGGFDSRYWPGEDTKLCLDLTHKLNKKILYDPDVVVWHHRREGLGRHLRQVGGYGLHRGFFAKTFPETSLKGKYFLPALFVLFLMTGLLLILVDNAVMRTLYYSGSGLYLAALGVAFFQITHKGQNFAVAFASLPYIVLTHICYGIHFLQGLVFTKELKRKLRRSTT